MAQDRLRVSGGALAPSVILFGLVNQRDGVTAAAKAAGHGKLRVVRLSDLLL